jgi:hypothetical protein
VSPATGIAPFVTDLRVFLYMGELLPECRQFGRIGKASQRPNCHRPHNRCRVT